MAHRVAVGASSGVVSLWFNKSHHADHRILTPEFEKAVEAQAKKYEVPLITIDEFMKGIDGPVSFVKIDVQGYELPVCQGMEKTIDNNPEITVAFEYAPGQMQDLGFSGEDLLVFFRTRGFDLYVLDRKGTLEPLDGNNMAAYLARTQYFDVLATRRKIN